MNGVPEFHTPKGLRIVGPWENDRNADNADLYRDIIRECFNVTDVIVAHHLVYVTEETRDDGFTYQVIQEVPSADSLIFNHDVAKVIFGDDWQDCLVDLALEPVCTRDALLEKMYRARHKAS